MKKLLILALMMVTVAACTTTRYVPVETVKTEYITRDSIRIDSTYVHDSVYFWQSGDTVREVKYRNIYKYMFLTKTDTVISVDTITVVQEVEKHLTKWQQWKMDFGGGAIIATAIIVIGFVVYLVRRFI